MRLCTLKRPTLLKSPDESCLPRIGEAIVRFNRVLPDRSPGTYAISDRTRRLTVVTLDENGYPVAGSGSVRARLRADFDWIDEKGKAVSPPPGYWLCGSMLDADLPILRESWSPKVFRAIKAEPYPHGIRNTKEREHHNAMEAARAKLRELGFVIGVAGLHFFNGTAWPSPLNRYVRKAPWQDHGWMLCNGQRQGIAYVGEPYYSGTSRYSQNDVPPGFSIGSGPEELNTYSASHPTWRQHTRPVVSWPSGLSFGEHVARMMGCSVEDLPAGWVDVQTPPVYGLLGLHARVEGLVAQEIAS